MDSRCAKRDASAGSPARMYVARSTNWLGSASDRGKSGSTTVGEGTYDSGRNGAAARRAGGPAFREEGEGKVGDAAADPPAPRRLCLRPPRRPRRRLRCSAGAAVVTEGTGDSSGSSATVDSISAISPATLNSAGAWGGAADSISPVDS